MRKLLVLMAVGTTIAVGVVSLFVFAGYHFFDERRFTSENCSAIELITDDIAAFWRDGLNDIQRKPRPPIR